MRHTCTHTHARTHTHSCWSVRHVRSSASMNTHLYVLVLSFLPLKAPTNTSLRCDVPPRASGRCTVEIPGPLHACTHMPYAYARAYACAERYYTDESATFCVRLLLSPSLSFFLRFLQQVLSCSIISQPASERKRERGERGRVTRSSVYQRRLLAFPRFCRVLATIAKWIYRTAHIVVYAPAAGCPSRRGTRIAGESIP